MMKIWVVDDEPGLLRSLRLHLKQVFPQAEIVLHDGPEEVPRHEPWPDLVVSDVEMPGCDGFRLMAELYAAGYNGSTVLWSGNIKSKRSQAARFTLTAPNPLTAIRHKPDFKKVVEVAQKFLTKEKGEP